MRPSHLSIGHRFCHKSSEALKTRFWSQFWTASGARSHLVVHHYYQHRPHFLNNAESTQTRAHLTWYPTLGDADDGASSGTPIQVMPIATTRNTHTHADGLKIIDNIVVL